MKICRRCGSSYLTGSRCAACRKRQAKEGWQRLKDNPEYKEYKRAYNSRPDVRAKRRERQIRQYGLTSETYTKLFEEQKGVCAICKRLSKGRALAVDHDHTTGDVRGLLCTACNVALETLVEVPNWQERAKEYLRNHRPQV